VARHRPEGAATYQPRAERRRRAALGTVTVYLAALKGRNRNLAIVAPFQGFGFNRRGTQGGAPRLRRFALPWADMLRPLRGDLP
jgi:hypothetical protein